MKLHLLVPAALLAALLCSCIKEDQRMGSGLVDSSLQYDTYTAEFNLEDLEMRMADNLSGFSDSKIVIGSIRDDVFGLTTRTSAFTLIPANDTLDLGKNPVPVKFDVHFACDTISVKDESQRHILQNVNVFALTKAVDAKKSGTNQDLSVGTTRISKGVPVVNGKDSLSIEFTDAFAKEYIDKIQALENEDHAISSYEDYVAALPGVCVSIDPPAGLGGRINLFELSVLSLSEGKYYRNNNIALLTINSEYNGVRKDTTFLFVPGEPTFYYEPDYLAQNTKFYQYAFNRTSHESGALEGKAGANAYIEGGGGLKPVVTAKELRDKALAEIGKKGDPSKAIINHASIILPFEVAGEDYEALDFFPDILSPTCMIKSDEDGTYTFAGLSDASAATENQGDIDRSNLRYATDITHHFQELLRLQELEKLSNYDVWFIIVHKETREVASSSSAENDYLQQMLYASYYNSLYGGYGGYGYGGYGYGYGNYGYGGYGGYGGYSNYYNYLMLSNYLNASSSSKTQTTTELDKDRYYCAILNGPAASSDRKPKIRFTFSLPKK